MEGSVASGDLDNVRKEKKCEDLHDGEFRIRS